MQHRRRRKFSAAIGLVAGSALLLASCAQFDTSMSDHSFGATPPLTPKVGGQPQLPGEESRPSQSPSSSTSVPPPDGCKDFDKAVIETCLDTVVSIAALPGSEAEPTALVAERKTGKILRVAPESTPQELITLPVSAVGDGGLTSIALSPTYAEDQLVFAYITTAEDNRVVRIGSGDSAKPVLTGIPKGANGNRGALMTDAQGALLVATGDAGDPARAANGQSLAGKILRIDTAGKPANGNPTPDSPIFASGLHAPGGMCRSNDGTRMWVTDQTNEQDVVHRIQPGTSLAAPIWAWSDKPGISGCSDSQTALLLAASGAGNIQNLPLTPDGMSGGSPSATMDGKNGTNYGKLAGMEPISPEYMLVSTINKDGGQPVSSDDRVIIMPRQPSSGGGGRD